MGVSAQTALLEGHSGGWQRGEKKAPAKDLKDRWSWLRLLFRKIIQEDGRGKKDLSRGSEGLVVLAQTALLEDHSGGWRGGGGGRGLGRGPHGLVVHGLSSNCSSGRSFCRKMVEGKKDLSRGSERRMAEGQKKTSAEDLKGGWQRDKKDLSRGSERRMAEGQKRPQQRI